MDFTKLQASQNAYANHIFHRRDFMAPMTYFVPHPMLWNIRNIYPMLDIQMEMQLLSYKIIIRLEQHDSIMPECVGMHLKLNACFTETSDIWYIR